MRPPAGGSQDKEVYKRKVTYSAPEGQALFCWPMQNRDPAERMGEGAWAPPFPQGGPHLFLWGCWEALGHSCSFAIGEAGLLRARCA